MNDESLTTFQDKIIVNRAAPEGPRIKSLVLFLNTRENDCIYYFKSEHKELKNMLITEFKAQPCDRLPEKRLGDSNISFVWGNNSLWIPKESR